MGGDLLFNFLHFILWTIVIVILEAGLLGCLRRTCRCKDRVAPKKDLELDEDVIEEEKRIENYLKGRSRKLSMDSSVLNRD